MSPKIINLGNYDNSWFLKKFLLFDIILSGTFFLLEFVNPLLNLILLIFNLISIIFSSIWYSNFNNISNSFSLKIFGFIKWFNSILRIVSMIIIYVYFFDSLLQKNSIYYFYSTILLDKENYKFLIINLYLIPSMVACIFFSYLEFHFFIITKEMNIQKKKEKKDQNLINEVNIDANDN